MQMGEIGGKLGIDFVVSTGDNFYKDGLTGVNDPAFTESFTKIYSARSLQRPWYASESSKIHESSFAFLDMHKILACYNSRLCFLLVYGIM